MSRKEPRFRLDMEVTFNEFLSLFWSLQWLDKNAPDAATTLPDKQTLRKLEREYRRMTQEYSGWRSRTFKSAGGKDYEANE